MTTLEASPLPTLLVTPPRPASAVWKRVVGVLLTLIVAAAALFYGLQFRRFVWDFSTGAHYRGDVNAGWHWGERAAEQGLLSFYQDLEWDVANGAERRIDYPPLRLSMMTAWYRWTQVHYPNATGWRDDFDFTSPLLNASTAAEGISAVLVFFIIRLLKIRMDDATRPPEIRPRPLRGVAAGLFGALLFWFNPAVIWDSHAFPQWDAWLMPLFLGAVLAACLDAWFVAGVCGVVGAFLKGQMLLGAPILLLWPLLGGRFSAVTRLICGLVFGTAAMAAPWMMLGWTDARWLGGIAIAIALLLIFDRIGRRRSDRIDIPWSRWRPPLGWALTVAVVAVALALAWPWAAPVQFPTRLLSWTPLAVVAIACGLPRRLRLPIIAAAMGLAVLLTMPILNAGHAWLTTGFIYGTEKFEHWFFGAGVWNIPALLTQYLRWPQSIGDPYDPAYMVNVPGLGQPLTVHQFTRGMYVIALLFCGVAAAFQARRRDTRLLVAIVLPWLAAFMLLSKMHERHSVWAAGFCALLAGESIGLGLLGLLVSIISMLGIIECQLNYAGAWSPATAALLERLDPHLGLLLLLVMAILFYTSLAPRKRPLSG